MTSVVFAQRHLRAFSGTRKWKQRLKVYDSYGRLRVFVTEGLCDS